MDLTVPRANPDGTQAPPQKIESCLRISEQKLNALAEQLSVDDPDLAKAIRTAWQMPARSLAFRNAAHQKDG